MHIQTDFPLIFDEQSYIDFHGEGFARLLDRPGVRSQFEQAMAEAPEIVAPAACWDSFPVRRFLHSQVELEGRVRLGGGPLVEVMGGAEQVILAVCTVGSKADERIKALQADGQRFTMLVLEELAIWAVDQVRQQLCRKFETEQQERGWHSSTVLSPGESEWSVSDQEQIFKLLDASQIGVRLSPGMVMYPLKSISMAVGIGPQPMGIPGMTHCDYCSMKERCKYAQLGEDNPLHAVAL
ncbi:MAG: hypothetical protein J5I90_13805 [Caldilineales bacterium]|nr:hypothetical protein [Caldilineales bacterium]